MDASNGGSNSVERIAGVVANAVRELQSISTSLHPVIEATTGANSPSSLRSDQGL